MSAPSSRKAAVTPFPFVAGRPSPSSSWPPATTTPPDAPSYPAELTDVTGFRTLRQVAWAGSFEGQSTIALGVRAQLPFRAFILTGPGTGSMLVVDVAHLW
jgi:hypothetical protein